MGVAPQIGPPMPMRQSTTKIPPGWSDADNHQYSFKQWVRDLKLWVISTELDEAKVGPAIVQRLGGMAREVGMRLSEIASTHHTLGTAGTVLQYGGTVGFGGGAAHYSGVEILLHHLNAKFGMFL